MKKFGLLLIIILLLGCAGVPDSADKFYSQGILTIKNNNPETGIEYKDAVLMFDEGITIKPNHYQSLVKRADVAMQYREFQDAVIYYGRAIKVRPRFFVSYNKRGEAYFRLKKYVFAIKDFQKSIVLNPQHAIAPLNLCYVFVVARQFINARRYCDRVLVIEPGNPYALQLKQRIIENNSTMIQ
ncbi:MAG: tetratricopeptide repeat protein [Alphaproteobacteria bacterium]